MLPSPKTLVRFIRSPRSKNAQSIGQAVGGVSLLDSSPKVDVLDVDLFYYDYDLWFSKAMFQYHVAMVIQNEHLGHAVVNPKALLEQVEASFWKNDSANFQGDGNVDRPGSELFKRIKAARATKNDDALKVFLDDLAVLIKRHCTQLRRENVAELDAPFSPSHIHRVETSGSDTSSNSSIVDSEEESITSQETEIPPQGSCVQNTVSSDSHSPPLLGPCAIEPPIHWYTSILSEYAATTTTGEEPKYTFSQIPTNAWRCEGSFAGVCGVGQARNKKDAKHIASREICQTLGISKD